MTRKLGIVMRKAFISIMIMSFSMNVLAGAIYKFGTPCTFDTMLFPISFQHSSDSDDLMDFYYNIIWIDGTNNQGIDSYYNFFIPPYNNQNGWPAGVGSGKDTPKCTGTTPSTACANTKYAKKNHGVSAYDFLKSEFGENSLKVMSGKITATGNSLNWLYLPVRRVKLLRIEVFTPPEIRTISTTDFSPEPLYFEYRGDGELTLKESGTTTHYANKNMPSVYLPQTFSPVLSQDIQIWFGNIESYNEVEPRAHIDPLTSSMLNQIPAGCKS